MGLKIKFFFCFLFIFFYFLHGDEIVTQKNSIPDIYAKEYILSNGMKIYFKPTNFVKGETLIHIFAKGGYACLPLSDLPGGKIADKVAKESGLAFLSADQFSSFLYRNSLEFTASIKPFTREISGLVESNNLSLFFKVVNSFFNTPSFTENSFKKIIASEITNSTKKSSSIVCRIDTCTQFEILNQVTHEDLMYIDFEKTRSFFLESFADPSEFICIVVGDFNRKEVLSLAHKYLGNIILRDTKKCWSSMFPGGNENISVKEITLNEVNYSLTKLTFPLNLEITQKNHFYAEIVATLIELRLRTIFGSGISNSKVFEVIVEYPLYPHLKNGWIAVQFRTDKIQSQATREKILREISNLRIQGANSDEIKKMKYKIAHKDDPWIRTNQFWVGALSEYYFRDWDLSKITTMGSDVENFEQSAVNTILLDFLPKEEKDLRKGIEEVIAELSELSERNVGL